MLVTIAGTAISLLALGFADSLVQIFFARILTGIFGANISVATAYLTDVTEESERTRWMGMVGASFAVGFTLGPPIGGLLAGMGHGAPMLFAAGLAFLNLVWAASSLVEPERQRARDVRSLGNRFDALRNDAVRRICLVYFLYSLAVTQLETTFAYFMLHRFGYRELGVGMVMFGMAIVMGGIQGGAMKRLAERYAERSLALTGLSAMVLGFAMLPWVTSVALLMAPLALLAIARGLSQPPLLSLVSLYADDENRGIVMGVFQSSASGARIFGPLIAGALYDLGQGFPYWMAAALVACSALLARGIRTPNRAQDRAASA
jgi:DHA1 family tetracycline resistance protein-like MFS transporter